MPRAETFAGLGISGKAEEEGFGGFVVGLLDVGDGEVEEEAGVGGGEFEGALVGLDGVGVTLHAGVGDAEVAEGGDGVGFEFEDGEEALFGGIEVAGGEGLRGLLESNSRAFRLGRRG